MQLSCLLPTYILAPHSSCYSQKWKMSNCPVYFLLLVSYLRPGQRAVTVQIHMDTFWRLSSYVVYPHSFTWSIVSHDFPPCSNYSYFILLLHLCGQRPLLFIMQALHIIHTDKEKFSKILFFLWDLNPFMFENHSSKTLLYLRGLFITQTTVQSFLPLFRTQIGQVTAPITKRIPQVTLFSNSSVTQP